ncbi:4a-hydroxytetrahydrobiopterin dehydratase [Tomitella fengzijianii]|uniref:4a-hydroxytetrahydrobiopterin dehydratase n=1 Tax=Tomitella fengzijianii TaxID=2597660 RepID=UPI00131B9463|nr:4a-hydroxytetrahydrobiopterin dehydratase [Tomitella fengzijianii]
MSTALSADAIASALQDLPGWAYDPGPPALVLEAEAPTFPEGIEWVRRVAEHAESVGHHPDIDIRWRTVTFRCSTHSDGAVTEKDVALAAEINRRAPG